jgi:hypothetical protein
MLQAIADSTKVPLPLLAGLERGDIEGWPSGLFGRAHFRAYAAAVGLSPEPLMNEFLRLFGSEPPPTQAPGTLTPEGGPRLTLAEDRRWGFRSIGMRARASALDLCGVITIAAAFARILQGNLWLACALVGLIYYSLSTMALGQSMALWWLGGRALQRTGRSTASVRKVLLMPRRGLRAAGRQESPVDFRENPSTPVAQAASR